MKTIALTALALTLAACSTAGATGNLAQVRIVDKETGSTLKTHYYRGDYWVAGVPGHRYAIEVRNNQAERLMAITSVDGVNVITGDTAGYSQSGYVFAPYDAFRIDGWRKSDTEVAAFTFTASSNSYAARTGRAANVGVIGLAVFRELQRPRLLEVEPARRMERDDGAAEQRTQAQAPAPATDSAGASASANAAVGAAADSSTAAREMSGGIGKSLEKLGTGHGQREYSYVETTAFTRASTRPDEIIRIRYDSYERLVAMGVIQRPRSYPHSPDPFPESPLARYVPDPPGRY
jgi:hypothetical protein